ncbi:hypothetical protein [Longimicrobium sp.]|jgi:hypothetical protein|uniref:hypothetical protein n=1 Tax=Longimicrobium sp. TaxID=2029185 RepID=UPI002F92F924
MLLARSAGAATLRAPALAICAAAFVALAACGLPGGELLLGMACAARSRARDGDEPDSRAAAGYCAGRLIARASADGRQTPVAVRYGGQDGGPPAFEGVAGRVAFDSNGDPVNKQFTLGAVQGGRIVLPTGAR